MRTITEYLASRFSTVRPRSFRTKAIARCLLSYKRPHEFFGLQAIAAAAAAAAAAPIMCVSPSDKSLPAIAVARDDGPTAAGPLLGDEKCQVLVGEQEEEEEELPLLPCRFSSLYCQVVEEIIAISRISAPLLLSGLLNYARNLVSMLFLGHLGRIELAAGSLATSLANITGYSIIAGLAMGMEPICGQAFGAKRWNLLSLALVRMTAFLLLASVLVSLLWHNMDKILLQLGQDPAITTLAKTYLFYASPDLVAQSILQPLRIYLRMQNFARPIAVCTALSSLIHVPASYCLVNRLGLGIKGVAMATVVTDFSLVMLLACYVYLTGLCNRTWGGVSMGCCFSDWGSLVSQAIPSCISICLEWWWYELIIIWCGLLKGPEETVSAVGILMQLTAFIYVFPSSLSYGVSARVAHELGAGRPKKAHWAASVGAASGALIGLLAMAFDVSAMRWWGLMFTDDGRVLRLVTVALPVLGMCELGNCPQTIMCGALRGSARAAEGANVNLAGFYGLGLPAALLLGFWVKLGFVGFWLGLLVAQAWCAVVLGVVLSKSDWEEQARRAEELTGAGEMLEEERGEECQV